MKTLRRMCLTISGAAFLLAGLAAQTPPSPAALAAGEHTSAISGVVFDASTKQPVPRAVVTLGVFGASSWRDWQRGQLTDDRGRFAFVNLAPGDYDIVVEKVGYFDGRFGADATWDTPPVPVRLASDEWFSDADVPLTRPGSLSGTVRDEFSEPVMGIFVRALARVPIAGVMRFVPGPLTETDDRGMYRVANLRPGRYAVIVPSVVASVPAKADFPTLVGRSQEGIEAAQRAGRPLPSLDPLVEIDAARQLVVRGYPVPPPPDPRLLAYPITFAGGGWGDQATVYSVEAGSALTAVDVSLTPMPAVRISGQVEGPAEARANLTLRLLPEGLDDLGVGGEAGTTLVGADGSFVFGRVPSGTYVIEVAASINSYRTLTEGHAEFFYGLTVPRPPGSAPTSTTTGAAGTAPPGVGFTTSSLRANSHWARTRVAAGPDGAANVVVALQPTRTVRGRLIATMAANRPIPGSTPRSIQLESADGSPARGIARSGIISDPNGEFAISGILPGRYVLRGDSLPWMIRSVFVDGRDHTHAPIEVGASDVSGVSVTFTNEAASLSGTVRDAAGLPATDAGVIVFPMEPDQWIDYGLNPRRVLTARASPAGEFRVPALPAGTYQIVAVPMDRLDDWRQPVFFRRAQAWAERVTVAWGEERTQDLRLQWTK